MIAYEIIKISREIMKLMSECDIKSEDYKYIPLYEEYLLMREDREKYRYIIAVLATKYSLSQSTVTRIVRRFSKAVKA